jgi:hypothetical protein
MGCGGGGGGRGRARSGSHPSGRFLLMYPATWAKCASVASHIDPVKLRTSFEYSASFTYVSDAQSQMLLSYLPRPEFADRHSTYLTEEVKGFQVIETVPCDASESWRAACGVHRMSASALRQALTRGTIRTRSHVRPPSWPLSFCATLSVTV